MRRLCEAEEAEKAKSAEAHQLLRGLKSQVEMMRESSHNVDTSDIHRMLTEKQRELDTMKMESEERARRDELLIQQIRQQYESQINSLSGATNAQNVAHSENNKLLQQLNEQIGRAHV